MVRIAVLIGLIGLSLSAGPAAAQFNIFNEPPPRPPGDVPNGGFPAQPPPPGYPNQSPYPPGQSQYPGGQSQYPNQPQYPSQSQYPAQQQYPPRQQYPNQPQYPNSAAAPPPSGIQAQPLPPPPGATAAPPPAPSQQQSQQPNQQQRARTAPQPGSSSPQQANTSPQSPDAAPPADAAPPTDDTVVTETPTQKIPNGRAVFSGLDKITGRIISFDAAIGETVQFGALQVTARACYTRPPTEATNTDAFVEVDEVTLKGEIKRIFTGWMFASSPGLHAVEHPIYDVWLTDCAQPAGGSPVAQSGPPPFGAPPPPGQARPRSPSPSATAGPRRPPAPVPGPSAPAPVTDD
jgi:hypothetical protein